MYVRNSLLAAALVVCVGMASAANAQETEQERAREEARAERETARLEQERAREEARTEMEAARLALEEAARKVAELSGRPGPFITALRTGAFGGRSVLGVVVEDGEDGVHVTGVTPGGPAATAGVAVGDVITAIDTVTLTGDGSESQRLIEHMAQVDDGQEVVLDIERDGNGREITVKASQAEPSFFFQAGGPGDRIVMGPGSAGIAIAPEASATWVGPNVRMFNRFLGGRWNELELVALTEELGIYFGTSEGLLVVRAPDDDTIGLQDGDVLLEIGGRTPTSPEHAMRILMSFESGETLTFSIMRRQRRENIEYVIPGNRTPG